MSKTCLSRKSRLNRFQKEEKHFFFKSDKNYGYKWIDYHITLEDLEPDLNYNYQNLYPRFLTIFRYMDFRYPYKTQDMHKNID